MIVDCQWSEITWSRCSISCKTNSDKGSRTGTRFVIQEAQNGGLDCTGSSTLQEPCQNLPQCGKMIEYKLEFYFECNKKVSFLFVSILKFIEKLHS